MGKTRPPKREEGSGAACWACCACCSAAAPAAPALAAAAAAAGGSRCACCDWLRPLCCREKLPPLLPLTLAAATLARWLKPLLSRGSDWPGRQGRGPREAEKAREGREEGGDSAGCTGCQRPSANVISTTLQTGWVGQGRDVCGWVIRGYV